MSTKTVCVLRELLLKCLADLDPFDCKITIAKLEAILAHPPAPAIPEGYALVPKEIHLSASVIELINGTCGDGNEEGGYGHYQDGTLFVGHAVDDDGEKVYGLHLSCDECPEEGVVTLAEFTAAPQPTEGSTQPSVTHVCALNRAKDGICFICGKTEGSTDE